ncbi:tetratricopeptide repeat protein [Maribacter sp. 2210JD10-5]|uniref:tetratricopeptide repeat protein n=1 Tax=Maribacter sp. 2210JD10-5 TaxID=3386272 RepID=UPI0039BCFB5A
MVKKLFIFCCLCFSIWSTAQNETLFNEATTAYNEGEYQNAIDKYQKILDNGKHSAAVYFNLGNCHYKLNQIAPSIYYYEKALLLNPSDKEIQNNLGYAQNMTLDAIEKMPETGFSKFYKSITGKLFYDDWAYLSVGFLFLFVLLYIIFYYANYSTRKRWAFISSFVALFLCILFVVFAEIEYSSFKANRPAIVFADEIGIKAEPNDTSQEAFTLHEGAKVNVLDDLNEWYKISIADGQTGWIPAKEIRLIKDF